VRGATGNSEAVFTRLLTEVLTPEEEMKEIVLGSFVMVDIVNNPTISVG
jgi:hypothetical protein